MGSARYSSESIRTAPSCPCDEMVAGAKVESRSKAKIDSRKKSVKDLKVHKKSNFFFIKNSICNCYDFNYD